MFTIAWKRCELLHVLVILKARHNPPNLKYPTCLLLIGSVQDVKNRSVNASYYQKICAQS